MYRIKKLLKLKSWHRIVPRRRKSPEEAREFLQRIIRLAATRASMASWGQPFEAIASWFLLARDRDAERRRQEPHD
jgi:hypothetical protein